MSYVIPEMLLLSSCLRKYRNKGGSSEYYLLVKRKVTAHEANELTKAIITELLIQGRVNIYSAIPFSCISCKYNNSSVVYIHVSVVYSTAICI